MTDSESATAVTPQFKSESPTTVVNVDLAGPILVLDDDDEMACYKNILGLVEVVPPTYLDCWPSSSLEKTVQPTKVMASTLTNDGLGWGKKSCPDSEGAVAL